MPKQIVDLPIEPGVYTEQTARGATGRWKNADKVRWRYGLPQKIGGWTQVAAGPFKGLVRKIWDWTTIDKRKISALGTESKLYLYDAGDLFDVTPIRRSTALNNPFTTTITSTTVQVTDATHGAFLGDYVRFSNASAVGGITIDGEYQITAIIDTDTYQIEHTSAATSSTTGGGAVSLEYDISVGKTISTFGLGWSTGTWSQGTWGTPRVNSNLTSRLRTWSLDNWGEDLIANPRGGSIYWWDRSTGTNARATLIEDAPDRANFVIISQRDRHLFALGCTDYFTGQFDPLLVRWCSKEDLNDWIPTSTNTAGDLRLYRGSEIVGSVRTRGEILVFTDVSVHQINYLGGQSVYGVQVAGENVSLLGPNAAIEVDYRVYFMAEADFYMYDGVLRPIPCDVRNFVYNNLTVSQKDKVFAGINREFNEIWWFYPAKDADVYIETNLSESLPEFNYEKQSETLAADTVEAFDITVSNLFGGSRWYGYILGTAGSISPAAPDDTVNGSQIARLDYDTATFDWSIQISGSHSQDFFTSLEIEHNSGVTKSFDTATATSYSDLGSVTIWEWNDATTNWDASDNGQVRSMTFTTAAVGPSSSVYEVSVTSAGYAWLSLSPSGGNIDSVWIFSDSAAAKIRNVDDIDYEMTFTLNGTTSLDYGLFYEATDLTGTAGAADDNVDGLWVYVNPNTNVMTIGKNTSGTPSILDNAAASYDLSALTVPVTLTSGSKYGIRVSRSSNVITAYLWDEDQDTAQMVAQVTLSASEIVAFPGTATKSGVNFQKAGGTSDDDQLRLNSYRAGAGGSITSSEIWGPSTEVSRYVIYNYEEQTWSIGAMVRTAWADRSPVFEKPYASGTDMYLYIHETGVDEDGAAMAAFCETYDMEIPQAGEYLMHLDQLIPDYLELDGQSDIALKAKKYPQQRDYQEKGPYPVTAGVEKISTRIRGRQVALKVSSDAVGDFWRLGTIRARVTPHGKRA